MFKHNHSHRQPGLFGIDAQLTEPQRGRLLRTWGAAFYDLVFSRIDESIFEPLYMGGRGRPNAPVNALAAACVLMHHNGWTVDELREQVEFNLVTRKALGLDNLGDAPFCRATFFNFQSRMHMHFLRTGENLLGKLFDVLTARQLKELGVKTGVQRADSFQAMSNIAKLSRVQLLIEVLSRLHRRAAAEGLDPVSSVTAPHAAEPSRRQVYKLRGEDAPAKLLELSDAYAKAAAAVRSLSAERLDALAGVELEAFSRVFSEQFREVAGGLSPKKPVDVGSGSLQSPDDLDATYRVKSGKEFRGQVVSVAETADPGNAFNLVVDVAVAPNNVDDSRILAGRLEAMKAKTPDLAELHTDAGYASPGNDAAMEKLGVTHAETAVKGRKAMVPIHMDKNVLGGFDACCPRQAAVCRPCARGGWKAVFDRRACADCPMSADCPAPPDKAGDRVFRFDAARAAANERARNISKLPPERRTIRSNVEATMKEFTAGFNHKGKLRVRGAFACALYAFSTAVGINFGRIHRHLAAGDGGGRAPALGMVAGNMPEMRDQGDIVAKTQEKRTYAPIPARLNASVLANPSLWIEFMARSMLSNRLPAAA